MAKLCVKVGGVTKKLDLDGGGSVPSTGYNNQFTTLMGAPGQSGVKTATNSTCSLMLIHATFYYTDWTTTTATITNNGKAILDPFNIYIPGTDGKGRYPARIAVTFLLMKGDTLTFNTTPSQMVSRVIIP